jgi:hypothetical protein
MSLERDAKKLDTVLAAQSEERRAALRAAVARIAEALAVLPVLFPDGQGADDELAERLEDLGASLALGWIKSRMLPGGVTRFGEQLRAILAASPAVRDVAGDLMRTLGG